MDFILLKTLLTCLGLLLITFLIIYFLWPAALVRLGRWALRKMFGLQVRYAEYKGYRFCYYSRGKPGLQPSILMLHGFAFDKDTWLPIINFLPQNIHMICLDMPGYGETTCLPGDNYTTLDQVKRLHQFVECIGLDRTPFHLVGISMGGMVAGVYAAHYPSEICRLSLLCPTGLRYPKDTGIMKRTKENVKKHDFSLVPSNVQEGIQMFRLGLYNTHRAPRQFLKGFFADWLPDVNFFRKSYLDIFGDESLDSLDDNMSKIRVPTQVIWGKNDRMVDVSGADVLAKGVPHAQVHLLEKCGHFMPIDSPKETTQLLVNFHTSYMKNKKTE